MVEVIERETVGETIEATVNYVLDNGEKLFTQTATPGATDTRAGGTLDPHRVTIRNARRTTEPFTLDRHGFRFVRHDTKVADFFDDDEIRRVYYPEMEALVKAESGASRVVVFDHTLRTADDDQREARKIREVVRRAHNDYTEWSGPQRVRDLLPQEADALLQRRFAIVQVWRPIRHPVESFPLGDLRRAQHLVRRFSDKRAALSQPDRPNLRRDLQSRAPLVLAAAHAARGGAGVQGLRFGEGRARPLVCPHRIRGSDLAAQCAAAREHRNPHAGIFLTRTGLGRALPCRALGALPVTSGNSRMCFVHPGYAASTSSLALSP